MNLRRVRYLCALCLIVLVYSCHSGHAIYFDLEAQTLCSCTNSTLRNILIENDSVTKKGFPVEGGVGLAWADNEKSTPLEISLKNLPGNYNYTRGGLTADIKRFKLKPRSTYIIEKWGGGRPSFRIKIWTDLSGRVYKTTHETCDLNESLDVNEVPDPNFKVLD